MKHKQGAAEAALDQTIGQYRSVVLTAFQNVADALYALDADNKALNAAEVSEMAATKSLKITKQQLDIGGVSILALLNSETSYQQARVARIHAQTMRYTDTAMLLQSLGGGWQDQTEQDKQTKN